MGLGQCRSDAQLTVSAAAQATWRMLHGIVCRQGPAQTRDALHMCGLQRHVFFTVMLWGTL